MPDPPEIAFKVVTGLHQALIRLTGGRIGGRMMNMPVLLLTTTGRKTGQQRTTPLTYFTDGDDIVVIASKGGAPRHPAWYLNLVANPKVEIAYGTTTETRTARTATPEEKARLWPVITGTFKGYEGYQQRTERDIPVVILKR